MGSCTSMGVWSKEHELRKLRRWRQTEVTKRCKADNIFFLLVYLPTPPVCQIKEKSEKISQWSRRDTDFSMILTSTWLNYTTTWTGKKFITLQMWDNEPFALKLHTSSFFLWVRYGKFSSEVVFIKFALHWGAMSIPPSFLSQNI